MKREESKRGKIQTAVVPATEFYLAEDYHQKYALRNSREIMAEFRAMYPDLNNFVNSTAAAHVNGYIHGNGTAEQFDREAESLGLSFKALKILRAYIR